MSSDSEFFRSIGIELDDSSKQSTLKEQSDPRLHRLNSISTSTLALASVATTSIVLGFFGTLALAKRRDGASLDKALLPRPGMKESGTKLALRALGWGSFYALSGFSAVSFILYQFTKYRIHQMKERIEIEKIERT